MTMPMSMMTVTVVPMAMCLRRNMRYLFYSNFHLLIWVLHTWNTSWWLVVCLRRRWLIISSWLLLIHRRWHSILLLGLHVGISTLWHLLRYILAWLLMQKRLLLLIHVLRRIVHALLIILEWNLLLLWLDILLINLILLWLVTPF